MKKLRLLLLVMGVGIIANTIAAPPQEPLTVTVQGDGTVTSAPAGITCPSDCNENYNINASITLTATANLNSSFLGWQNDCIGAQPTCVVKMSTPINVTAVFDTTAPTTTTTTFTSTTTTTTTPTTSTTMASTTTTTLPTGGTVFTGGDDYLVYVATDPCRIVDTRGGGGAITANTSRNFASYGQDLSGQGGGTCPRPRPFSQPVAISAYVIAVPPNASSGSGVLTAYPAGNPVPPVGEGSTVNFAAQQIIGNTTTITLGNASQFAVLARNTDQHVVVDVQGYFYPETGSCTNDMVAVGSVCVDKYEASLVDSGGTPTDGTACDVSGSDCAGVIFAKSEAGVIPVINISWYQAAQACANVGKRLPTTAEWQMAASGTPAGTVDCNGSGAVANTGPATSTCVSNTGAIDMVGNLWEFSGDLDASQQSSGSNSSDDLQTVAFGCSYAISTCNNNPSTSSMYVLVNGPDNPNPQIGFRCVR